MLNVEIRESVIDRVAEYLKMSYTNLATESVEDTIRHMCVARLCESIGIRCLYNSRSKFFTFFSYFMAQAVSNNLQLNIVIAPDNMRFIRYNGINFVSEASRLLNNEDLDEAFIDAFNLADKNRDIIDRIIKKA